MPVVNYPENSYEEDYASLLTPYAYKYVREQINMVGKVIDMAVEDVQCDEMYIFKSENNQHSTSKNSCTCIFHKGMGLPCKHILAVRELMNISLFIPEVCDNRWSKAFYMASYRRILGHGPCHLESHLNTTQITQRSKKVLSYNEKYRKTNNITKHLTALVSQLPAREFSVALSRIALINDILEQGGHFVVTQVTVDGIDDISNQTDDYYENTCVSTDPHAETETHNEIMQNMCHGK